jgi:hypothetical protein
MEQIKLEFHQKMTDGSNYKTDNAKQTFCKYFVAISG